MNSIPHVATILAEFDSPAALLAAARKVKDAGYTHFDSHSPFPVHGMDEAMGLKRSSLGYWVGAVAFVAIAAATLAIWWITAVDFPMVISGKPYFSFQAFVPVIFAVTILSSALATLITMLALNRLPKLFHPLFESKRFAKVTDDAFFISIEADDPKFEALATEQFLKDIGSNYVEVIELA